MIKQYNYTDLAKYYDILELNVSTSYEDINNFLHLIFKKNKIKTILDMTCGTGAQAISLMKKGYNVTALDINKSMLAIAKEKSKGLNIIFKKGDIRTSKIGKFDAIISIFNAIGHLSKNDFQKALGNIHANLKEKGLYIFDIFNIDFMRAGGFIEYEFIDRALDFKGTKFVRFNKNKLDFKGGIIAIDQKTFIQESLNKPKIFNEEWDMKIYSIEELKSLLQKSNFQILNVFGGPNHKFLKTESSSIFIVCQKL
ncbi:class I SAM-dependent methyltransferase [Candidatus Woesearchaeota archaeon]|nr:class I SAM-dependent methyltransferase [Candidatus Woesearchaeota archaeon]